MPQRSVALRQQLRRASPAAEAGLHEERKIRLPARQAGRLFGRQADVAQDLGREEGEAEAAVM